LRYLSILGGKKSSGQRTKAKPQQLYLGSTPAKWLFHQEKATLDTPDKATATVVSL
jgi:hypothetical protein